MRNQQGFTLIELVSIIVILGILAVSAAPKFTGRSGFVEQALRDQIISTLRFAQQRAMYDHSGNCYRVVIASSGIQAQRGNTSINPDYDLSYTGDYQGLGVDSVIDIYFDGLGNTYTVTCPQTGAAVALAQTTITVTGTSQSLTVHPTGYIQKI